MTHKQWTEAEIDALEGRELDAAVAEYVMGWRKRRGPAYDYDGPTEAHDILVPPNITNSQFDDGFIWPPRGVIPAWVFCKPWSTDLEAAFNVAQYMAERLFRYADDHPDYLDDTGLNALTLAQCSSIAGPCKWFAAFQVFDEGLADIEPEMVTKMRAAAMASTAPLAICRAALKAVLSVKP